MTTSKGTKGTRARAGKSRQAAAVDMRRQAVADPVAMVRAPAKGAPLDRTTVISLRLTELAESVGERVTLSMAPPSVVRRDLLRYYAIMADEAREWPFDSNDLVRLRKACAGVSFASEKQVRALWAFAVAEFGEESETVSTLRSAPLAALYAVIDVLESGGPLESMPDDSGRADDEAQDG